LEDTERGHKAKRP